MKSASSIKLSLNAFQECKKLKSFESERVVLIMNEIRNQEHQKISERKVILMIKNTVSSEIQKRQKNVCNNFKN